jgi:hypothetical protein
MKIHEYNEMMAWLKKPKRLFSSRKDTIGGGAIQGEDLGSRMGFAGPRLIKQGPDKGKYIVRYRNPKFGKREGQKGYNEGNTEPMTKKEADAFYQDLQSKVSEKKIEGPTKPKTEHAKKINNFVNNFIDENIDKYGIRDFDSFKEELLKAFDESDIKDIPGRKAKAGDLPNIGTYESQASFPDFKTGVATRQKVRPEIGITSDKQNVYKKIFYSKVLDNNKDLKNKIERYFDYELIDKKFYKDNPNQVDRASLRKKYADVLTPEFKSDFIYMMDEMENPKLRGNIFKTYFGDKYNKYIEKRNVAFKQYEDAIKKIETKLGPEKLKQILGEDSIKAFMNKQHEVLNEIFDTSVFTGPDRGLTFASDHLEGITEIVKYKKEEDIARGLLNVVGTTAARNRDLGWQTLSKPRRDLISKIQKGINIEDNVKELNRITKFSYPDFKGEEFYKYDPKTKNVVPTKNFTVKYSPEEGFKRYFTELSTKDVGAKALLEQAKPGSELVQFLTKDEKTYEKIANNLFDKIKQNENVSLEQLTSLRKTYKNQREEALQEFGRLFCRTNSATGGRINLAQAGSPNICSPEEMLSNMKKDKIIAQGTDDAAALAKGRLLKAGKSVGKVLGYVAAPVDIAIELAFAGPSLLRGDVQGAINATTFGMLGGGKTGMEQVGEKFGKDSTEYALYGIEESIKDKMVAMDGLQKLFSESEQLGLIPSEEGVMQKQIGLEPQQKALLKQFANQFKNLGDLDKKATQNFETFYPLTIDKMQNTKALQNIADFSTSQQPLAGKLDPNTVEGFIKSSGGVFEKEMLPRFTLPQYEENIRKLQELRIADFPLYLQSQLAGYEESQIPSEEEQQLMLRQRQAMPPFVMPFENIRYKGYKQGGRIQFANGGRLSFAEGPEDPKKRATLKKIGIGGGIAGGLATGLINILDLFKGGAKKGVVATKAAQSQAEKLFFDLVNAVKNKGIIDKLDRASDFSRGGAYYEYKGVKVLEDGENIELQFTTDKGAPAVVEYRKPSYDVDPEAGTSYKVPGEFTNEGQEIARFGKDGDVDIDFENEIIDPIENVKKIIDD